MQTIIDTNDLIQCERDSLYTRLKEVVRKKPTSRRHVQEGGQLTTHYAQEIIKEKDQRTLDKYNNQVISPQKEASKKKK
jgi:hypothetical protein